jgi:YHS domain-containing protein
MLSYYFSSQIGKILEFLFRRLWMISIDVNERKRPLKVPWQTSTLYFGSNDNNSNFKVK